jgi:hypothetical protein
MPEYLFQLVALFLGIFGAVWSLAWWLSGKFSKTHQLIYDQIEKLGKHFDAKIDYHEKHDDQRFQNISNDLWEIKLRNAAIRGLYLNTDDDELMSINTKVKKILKETK